MNVKNYRGKTADECMKKLKSDLGSDAVILQSRTIKPILGRFGRPLHEIIAVADTNAVLDRFAEHASERRTEEQENSGTAETMCPSSGARPRLTLSSGSIGNTALANQAQPASRRERLTLAEAAELHEQGAYDRLIAAGVLQNKAAPPLATREAETGSLTRDLQIVYSGATAQPATTPEDERIARLEKQIALLATALKKQSAPPPQASHASPAKDLAPQPKPDAPSTDSTNDFVAVPVPVVAAKAPELVNRVALAASMPMSPDSPQPSVGESVVEKMEPAPTGLGGFLRYRLPVPNLGAPKHEASVVKSEVLQPRPVVKRQTPPPARAEKAQQAASGDTKGAGEPLPVSSALLYLKALSESQVAEPLLRRIGAELPPNLSGADARETIHDLLTQRMLIGGALTGPTPGKMTLAALLGPSGVGKTTTVAKLAATLALSGECRVAMITLDTSRVAAAEQLKGYGEAMNIPVRVAYDRAELEAALMELAGLKIQVVLIDTPGRGPMESLSLAEMSQSMRALVDLRSYVVIPAPLSGSNFENTIQRFIKIAKPSALILTKMDETADNHCLGFLLNAQAKYQLPLAYVTMGARVPDDLLVADAHLLVNKLMNTGLR